MLVPLGEQMLKERGGFSPYAGAMLPDGSLVMLGGPDAAPPPSAQTAVDLLEASLREAARQRKYRATGIVSSVKTVPPGGTEQMDAFAVELDHEDGYSVVVMIPYRLGPRGGIVKGSIFAVSGAGAIFPPR